MYETTWTTKDGITKPISELETSHLVNIVKFLCRKALKHCTVGETRVATWIHASTFLQGEMALDSIGDDPYWDDRGDDDEWSSYHNWLLINTKWESIIQECDRRQIDWRIIYHTITGDSVE